MKVLRPSILFFVVIIALLHLTSEEVFAMEEKNLNYQIIYLNGPSSSEKSELVKALQNSLDQPLLDIGIYKVIAMMPAKINNLEGEVALLLNGSFSLISLIFT